MKASLYYESYCGGCEYFITNELNTFHGLADMMAITDLELVPYGNARVITRDPPTFSCQHGEKECFGNMVELCAIKHFPDRWWNFVVCEEKNPDFSDDGIAVCASEADIDAAEIIECSQSEEGPRLHLEAADKTPKHEYVPWVVVNGKVMSEQDDFLQMVCDAYEGKKPASCSKQSNEVEKVKMSLYYEVFCPGCYDLITGDLKDFHEMKDMMAITDIEVIPYGNAEVLTRDPPTFKCQHGDEECYGNWVELCGIKHNPDKWWEWIQCGERVGKFDDASIDRCSFEGSVPLKPILECAHGTEGPLLLLEAADKTPEHKYVPWLVVDGKVRDQEDLVEMVCNAYKGEKPDRCKQFM